MNQQKTAALLSSMATTVSALTGHAATFQEDLAFLRQHTDVIVLADPAGKAKVALAPAWQGRVMTSTAGGEHGLSFGWINRELIASGAKQPHIHVWGGEDRFWLGPEGGQFSIFFAKGAPFDLKHWFTPAALDTEPFRVAAKAAGAARFTQDIALTNYAGTRFDLKVDREVRLLSEVQTWRSLGLDRAAGVNSVAFESNNKITNTGPEPWRKETGLLSIWILGMFNPSPTTTIVVPLQPGPEAALGPQVTSDYFGEVPASRLVVKGDVVFFSGDGKFRSKIGLSPRRSKGLLGSYDATSKVLTLVRFTQPAGVTDYVNSLWKLQDNPFGGDAANSYNDGPPAPGAKPLGPFYELESSSPAAALSPRSSQQHTHTTIHLIGTEAALDDLARKVLGVSLARIEQAFADPAGAK